MSINKTYFNSLETGNTLVCGSEFESATFIIVHVATRRHFFKIFQEFLKFFEEIVSESSTNDYMNIVTTLTRNQGVHILDILARQDNTDPFYFAFT